jgi:hypothetical protein
MTSIVAHVQKMQRFVSLNHAGPGWKPTFPCLTNVYLVDQERLTNAWSLKNKVKRIGDDDHHHDDDSGAKGRFLQLCLAQ